MNALLTGASRGIGYNTALSLCEIGLDNLVLVSRNAEGLNKLKQACERISKDTNIICIKADITELLSEKDCLVKKIPFSVLDIVINNAGLLINKPFTEFNSAEGKRIFDVNFHAPAILIQSMLALLSKSKAAHVVNISSIGGFQGSSKFPGLSYYSASKAAIASLTECLATEFLDTNISFNCLSFGAVQSEMLDKAFPGYKAPITAAKMGKYVADFAISGHKYYNGQILPVRLSNP